MQRISPRKNLTSKSSSPRRFNSLPLLDKLSNPIIWISPNPERRVFARLNPANPQIPVINIFMTGLDRVCWLGVLRIYDEFCQIFFQPRGPKLLKIATCKS